MASDLSFIVERLNAPPFNYDLSLVTFADKPTFELLEIVNSVMGFLSEEHRVDLRDETPEGTANRMAEFLRILNYDHGLDFMSFKQSLLLGDTSVIFPMLMWLLQRLPELEQRAYLARYLVNVNVPEHLLAEPDVQEAYEEYKDLQQQFTEVHKAARKVRTQRITPTEIKKAIVQMEEDKEQLTSKIDSLHGRLKGLDNFEEMLETVAELREQQDEQMKLQMQSREQKEQLHALEKRFQQMKQSLADAQSRSLDDDPESILAALQREVDRNKQLAFDKLPREIDEYQTRQLELQRTLQEPPVSDMELQQLNLDVRRLEREIAALQQTKDERDAPADESLGMFKQQAAMVSKKRDTVMATHNELLMEKNKLEEELAAKERATAGSLKIPKGEELRKYAMDLREKTAKYKEKKGVLTSLKMEAGCLSRTEQLLQQKDAEAYAALSANEAARGVVGAAATKERLTEVSSMTAGINQEKEQSLEQISAMVQEANQQIKAQKTKLAPQIKELRALRTSYQDLEAEYLDRKKHYDATANQQESAVTSLQQEVNGYLQECAQEESRYHFLHAVDSTVQVATARAQAESSGTFTSADGEHSSYEAMYKARLKLIEKSSKELRDKQKKIKENMGSSGQQMKHYSTLMRLLDCKHASMMQAAAAMRQEKIAGQDSTNIFTMPAPSYDAAEQGMMDSVMFN